MASDADATSPAPAGALQRPRRRPAARISGQRGVSGSVLPEILLFHEYFNGDDGAGVGASHQTGWTALVAKLLQQSIRYTVR